MTGPMAATTNVTILFTDLVGSTELSSKLSAEDADELRRRIAAQSALRRRDGNRPLPARSRLLDAMDAGLPPCAGVALGFDRLLMSATGAASLSDVLAFPFDRA